MSHIVTKAIYLVEDVKLLPHLQVYSRNFESCIQTNYVCIYMNDVSRHFECDLLICANPDLSFDDRSR